MQGPVEERERGAFTCAAQGSAFAELVAPLDVGGRQRAERARHLGKLQVREVPRFERPDPRIESIVGNALSYRHAAAIIFTSFTPRNGKPLRSPLSSLLPCVSLSSPFSTRVFVSDSVLILASPRSVALQIGRAHV